MTNFRLTTPDVKEARNQIKQITTSLSGYRNGLDSYNAYLEAIIGSLQEMQTKTDRLVKSLDNSRTEFLEQITDEVGLNAVKVISSYKESIQQDYRQKMEASKNTIAIPAYFGIDYTKQKLFFCIPRYWEEKEISGYLIAKKIGNLEITHIRREGSVMVETVKSLGLSNPVFKNLHIGVNIIQSNKLAGWYLLNEALKPVLTFHSDSDGRICTGSVAEENCSFNADSISKHIGKLADMLTVFNFESPYEYDDRTKDNIPEQVHKDMKNLYGYYRDDKGECSACGRIGYERLTCSSCGEVICSDCAKQCAGCGEYFCSDCYSEHSCDG